MAHGIGVTAIDDVSAILRSYSVQVDGDRVTEVMEKPERVVNDLCGMGVYFFAATVFDHIDSTLPSPRTGRVEITDVIQRMIERGLHVAPVWFTGTYVNVTYPEDLRVARRIALGLAHRSPAHKRRKGPGTT
jgi:dTDP-glucose pyrophosphorylase